MGRGPKITSPETASWTMSVPDAGGKYYGLGRLASFQAAKAGLIPTVQIGKFLRALPRKIERQLAGEDD